MTVLGMPPKDNPDRQGPFARAWNAVGLSREAAAGIQRVGWGGAFKQAAVPRTHGGELSALKAGAD